MTPTYGPERRTSLVPLSAPTKENRSNPHNVFQERVVVAMVGLPARGKSYLSKAIVRYMNFLGCPTRLFNAGDLRRGAGLAGADASFFDPTNADGKEMRERLAMDCLGELLDWIHRPGGGCSLGILDATNSTRERRRKVMDRCREEAMIDPCLKLIFVESIADDRELLEQNYRMKLSNDDYRGTDPEKALADFKERVKKYEAVYEQISDDEADDIRYIKLVNAGDKLTAKGVSGFVPRTLLRLLGSIHLWPRTIWIALCGETEYDLKNILGGDPELTDEGKKYAEGISQLILKRAKQCEGSMHYHLEPGHGNLVIYTGTQKRYIQMAELICSNLQGKMGRKRKAGKPEPDVLLITAANTNDLCEGLLDSTTEEEREDRFPDEAAARRADKLNYRYPGVGGESYQDLIARCNELCCLLEQSRGNSLIICNRAVFRVVTAYFLGHTIEEIPHLQVMPGVLELHRDDCGFCRTQLEVDVGKPTSAVGVGSPIDQA